MRGRAAMAAGRFVALLVALLLAGRAARALYFHIGETEKRCFIEEIPDETMVIGAGVWRGGEGAGRALPPADRPLSSSPRQLQDAAVGQAGRGLLALHAGARHVRGGPGPGRQGEAAPAPAGWLGGGVAPRR